MTAGGDAVDPIGLVLSGGGARGAYEVGVLQGIREVLGDGPAPFRVFTGTSVGALNATWLAAHADRADMAVDDLADRWLELRIDRHLRIRPLRELIPFRSRADWSLLDVAPLAEMMTDPIPWDRLHANVSSGIVHALAVACLEVATGRTVIFAETTDGRPFRPTRDPDRVGRTTRIGPEHVLASTALPFLFPARRIDGEWFADGGLRFNTPVAPALRLGARRILVISLLHAGARIRPPGPTPEDYPSPAFLAGKTLNALLLDPIVHDMQMLERFNRIVEVLERILDDEAFAEVQRVIAEERGVPYRKVETLVFRPSLDIGRIANRHLRSMRVRRPGTWLLTRAMAAGEATESDLLSFLLFDRGFVEQLLDLGRMDALARREDILRFFAPA